MGDVGLLGPEPNDALANFLNRKCADRKIRIINAVQPSSDVRLAGHPFAC